ncbi:hypothetical protein [Virgibacillus sp. YIM 98842]|uniref:hypothetical protein n=1 Tax=Virgibacillus sp. YIM 98842 TaxID=2663533 RepID=UPI0013DD16B9|nr:hypothetical protein [Virgibacillus sp. YIM 98842]
MSREVRLLKLEKRILKSESYYKLKKLFDELSMFTLEEESPERVPEIFEEIMAINAGSLHTKW